jgi:cobalamin biosynthesis Mg chelatase CobN
VLELRGDVDTTTWVCVAIIAGLALVIVVGALYIARND